jgi:hypothetical protein
MCLGEIIKKDINIFGVGYKKYASKPLRGFIYSKKQYETEKWYSEAKYEDCQPVGNDYGNGYHVYINQPVWWNSFDSSINYSINVKTRVLYFGGFIIGMDNSTKTVVVRHMYILPDKLNIAQRIVVGIIDRVSKFLQRNI